MFPDLGPQNSDHNLSHNSYPLSNPLRFALLEKPFGGERQREIEKQRERQREIGGKSKNSQILKSSYSVFTWIVT